MEQQQKRTVRVDEYPLPGGARRPVAVIYPGGGYEKISDPLEGENFARQLNGLGCVAFVVHYSVGPAARFPAPLEDVAAAVRDILDRAEELNVDPADYSVWGASAGGHLAALFASEARGWKQFGLPRPGALVLCYPVVTMEEPLTHADSRLRLLGPDRRWWRAPARKYWSPPPGRPLSCGGARRMPPWTPPTAGCCWRRWRRRGCAASTPPGRAWATAWALAKGCPAPAGFSGRWNSGGRRFFKKIGGKGLTVPANPGIINHAARQGSVNIPP